MGGGGRRPPPACRRSRMSANAQEFAAQDTGARAPRAGVGRAVLWGAPFVWALFQLWIASPLPFVFNLGVLNDTQTRAIHLAFAVFIAFLAYPTLRRSPRHFIPPQDWLAAGVAAACAAYIWLFYNGIADRAGAPNTADLIVAGIGIVLVVGGGAPLFGLGPLMFVAVFFLGYVFFGAWEGLPDVVRWKGASFEKAMSHLWLTTEGVFGVALGVSSGFVFLFVMFGALLNQAGAGNYFVQIAFSLLGHLCGGPAKAAVVSSAMTGLVSGSSIANVVTTGTFTIPLMKRVGFSPEKAGAVEVSSSVNGVLTPPVMGAVAFLMTEYVGISYVEVVKHAIVPALISYIALVYIVHLEAKRSGMPVLPRATTAPPWKLRLLYNGIAWASLFLIAGAAYYLISFFKAAFGGVAALPIAAFALSVYVALVWLAAKQPELPPHLGGELPVFARVFKTGLYYIMPIVVLVWFLVVEWKSPAYSAFGATLFLVVVLLTQKPLKALFRREPAARLRPALLAGARDLTEGLVAGARNMTGLAAAMGVAGIIVGAVTLTGIGQVMAEFVEFLSGGNLLAMLFFVAVISIILGMGLPTTANYIVVSSLMAGVVVELGAQSGFVVPLVAVHMFCFYYGIMADVTPPVGLASFAAAAISGGDPLKTGFAAFFYSLRTALLPFLFIFNTDLLLIDVAPAAAFGVFVVALVAMLAFAAGSMGYFVCRSRKWESAALILAAFVLFRPGFFLDYVAPPFERLPPQALHAQAESAKDGGSVRAQLRGINVDGDEVDSLFLLPLGKAGASGAERLRRSAGVAFRRENGALAVDAVEFGKPAEKAGVDFDWQVAWVEAPAKRPAKEWMFAPALLLLAAVAWLQRRRAQG